MNDNIIYTTKLHWISYSKSFILMILGFIGVPLLIMGIIAGDLYNILGFISAVLSLMFFKGLYDFFYNKSIKICLYNKCLSIRGGILSHWKTDVNIKNLDGNILYQSFLGQKLGFGTLVILTKGGREFNWFIKNPQELNKHIESLIYK